MKLLLLVLYTVTEVTLAGRRLITFVLVLIRSLFLFLYVESTSLVLWLVLALNGDLLWDDDRVLQGARLDSAGVGVAPSAEAVLELFHCILQTLHYELVLHCFLCSLLVPSNLLNDLRVTR